MMGLFMVLVKNMVLLFLILSVSLLVVCKGGRELNNLAEADEGLMNTDHEVEMGISEALGIDEAAYKHERVLRANTRDYGRYDPAPALRHPPSKLIPRA